MDSSIKYTMSEVSNKLGLSEPWIRKIISHFGWIGWSEKIPGKKVYLTLEQIGSLERISQLRKLDLSLDEIKEIDKLEQRIRNLVNKHFSMDLDTVSEESVAGISTFLNIGKFIASNGVEYDCKSFEEARRQNKKEATELLDMLDEYRTLVDKLNRRASGYVAAYQKLQGKLNIISKDFTRVLKTKD